MKDLIDVKELTKVFPLSAKQRRENTERGGAQNVVAVDKLSFTAHEGEVFGLLGPNGAGKTTTLRMLATLIRPTSGDAVIGGCSVAHEPENVRSKIAFLTSELKLEEFFTPDYLYGFFSELHGVPADVAAARKKESFSRFGIDSFAHTKIANLSTGMKQKVSLVISLVHAPEIIIFDEPTNGLDIITAKTVTDFLCDLRTEGKTIIVSTHIFSLAEKICDRVGIIINGHMCSSGTLAELCAGRTLEEAFFDIYGRETAK